MIKVSEITKLPPEVFITELQRRIYSTLESLDVEFERVATEDVYTMDDCRAVDAALDMRTVKTLLLTNRQQTAFYLLVMDGSKAFITKDFSRALEVSRVSFATPDVLMSIAHVEVGAASFFCALMDGEHRFRVIFDNDVLQSDSFGCTDGTVTSYLKLRTADVLRILDSCDHTPEVIDL